MDVNGDLTIAAGSFTATSATLIVAGNLAKAGGTFSHNSGTVLLDGTGQSLSGSFDLYELQKTVTAADTLTFQAGQAYSVAGTATLAGASGNLLSLISDTPGSRWSFNLGVGATKSITYVSVTDSDASGSDASQVPIDPPDSVNGGNTVSWFPALLVVTKVIQIISDPVSGALNPKAIPGAVMLYTVTVQNQGGGTGDNDSVMINDPVPAGAELYAGDLGGPGEGPVIFSDGINASGLTYNFIDLSNSADDVDFSNDGGASFTHEPVPDGDGYDTSVPQVDVLLINPKGTINASDGVNHPGFQVQYRIRIH